MSVEPAPIETRRRSHTLDTRLHGHRLLLARGVWLGLVILTLVIFGGSLPVYVAQLQTPCAGSACWYTQLTPAQGEALQGMGLSLDVYAGYLAALTLAVMCLVVSTLIAWRRPDDRMAFLVALLLVTFGPLGATASVVAIASPWQVPNQCLYFLALALLVLVFLLFPSGQFVPGWMRWTLVVFLAGLVPTAFVAPAMPNTAVDQLTYLVSLGELATLAIVQLYRYRRVSSPLERQQTKWVVFGIAVLVTGAVSGSVLKLLFPVLASPASLYPLVLNVVFPFLVLLIPLLFGFAMLRSRLWEIDIIINRTLVYGLLPTIVETVAQALKLPYVAITLKQGEVFTPAASYGLPQDKPFTLPLVYHTETIGQLLLAPRARERLSLQRTEGCSKISPIKPGWLSTRCV